MFRFQLGMVLLTVGALGIGFTQAGALLGEDFRVDNAVYHGDQNEPSSESTTIFHGGVVYDCMETPSETVVFDKTADRFILLNPNTRTRTELTTTQLAAMADRLQMSAIKSKDPVVQFLAKPNFQESSNEAAGELTLASPLVTYRVILSPEPNPSIVNQYHEFCDYYARLNALLSSGSRPPFGRLVVNAALAQRQATASEVFLTTVVSGKGLKQQRIDIRSKHRVVCPLEQTDLDQVAKIRQQMDDFKPISFSEYRKTELR